MVLLSSFALSKSPPDTIRETWSFLPTMGEVEL